MKVWKSPVSLMLGVLIKINDHYEIHFMIKIRGLIYQLFSQIVWLFFVGHAELKNFRSPNKKAQVSVIQILFVLMCVCWLILVALKVQMLSCYSSFAFSDAHKLKNKIKRKAHRELSKFMTENEFLRGRSWRYFDALVCKKYYLVV